MGVLYIQFKMTNERHAGLVVGAVFVLIVKFVPGVRALMKYRADSLAVSVLQVVPRAGPKLSSKVRRIWEFAVTAVVLMVLLVVAALIVTNPTVL